MATNPDAQRQERLVPGTPEFLRAVRRAAGWRVSPRHLEPVLEALQHTGTPVTVERVAELVSAIHGDRSARQRRHPELWRLMGAYLALQGKPAHPEAQRAFIGRCRRLIGAQVSDFLLLAVAAEAGAAGKPLEARLIARAVRWLLEHGAAEADTEQIDELLPRAIEAAARVETPAGRPQTGQPGGRRPVSRRSKPGGRGPLPPRRRR
jgi:hypothetical protein